MNLLEVVDTVKLIKNIIALVAERFQQYWGLTASPNPAGASRTGIFMEVFGLSVFFPAIFSKKEQL